MIVFPTFLTTLVANFPCDTNLRISTLWRLCNLLLRIFTVFSLLIRSDYTKILRLENVRVHIVFPIQGYQCYFGSCAIYCYDYSQYFHCLYGLDYTKILPLVNVRVHFVFPRQGFQFYFAWELHFLLFWVSALIEVSTGQ